MRSVFGVPARLLVLLLLLSLAGSLSATGAVGAESEAELDVPEMEGSALVEVNLPSRDDVDALNNEGWDIAEYLRQENNGTVTVQIDAERDDFVELAKRGYKIQTVIADDRTWRERLAEREAAVEAEKRAKALVEGDVSAGAVARSAAAEEGIAAFAIEPEVTIQRVDYFENYAGRFVSIEAFTPNGLPGNAGPTLAVAWDSGPGTDFGNAVLMGKFTDTDPSPDVYMYHRHLVRIGAVGTTTPPTPSKVRVASSVGGVSEAPVKVWLGTQVTPFPAGFQSHFFNRYMDPTEIQGSLDQLVAEFPNLVEAINVPNLTAGYQRQAQGTFAPLAPTLAVAAASGSTGVRLSSTTGVTAGTVITIDPGANQEIRTVVSVVTPNPASPAPNVLFSGALANNHASGAAVLHGEQAIGSSAATGAQSSAVVIRTVAMGHLGGEQTRVAFVNPGVANAALSVTVTAGNPLGGSDITVHLATDGSGNLTSTAAQVVAAINAGAGSILQAALWATNTGAGIVQPRSLVALDDYLNAPAHVQRGPFQSKVYRIGAQRDGSKTGILLFCQQHAREWVTPLTCFETAQRLVRNYATDANTKELVDNLDIFIYPSLNPDGSHHSLYDFQSQRRNMVNYCAPTSTSSMPSGRNSWGVDLNRNESVGTLFDGYGGASTSCTSDVFAGPFEQSEAEIRNLNWVQDQNPNIKFSNNIHSSGGYFMWSPGAYINAGRITLPAPNIGIETYFFDAGDLVLRRIKEYRGTVIDPQRTGPIADVLYSAAGNSADDAWYRRGSIAYSFEVGADRFNVTARQPFAADAVAGATAIRLNTTASLSVGDSIIIAPGTANEESNVVAGIPSPAPAAPAPNVVLAKPLLNAHLTGTAVQEQTFGGVGFFPAYETEGRHEAMEFANGNYGLLESALLYSRDTTAPTSTTQVCTRPANEILCNDDTFEYSANPIDVTFRFQNEPSVIRYTLDGSTPNMSSQSWEAQAPRQPGVILNFTEPTLVKWFGTDIKGNVGGVREALFVVGTFDNNSGLLEPVSGGGDAKAGSTLPLKFSLGGYYSLAVLIGTPTSQQVNCTTGAPIGSSSPLGTPGASQFTFNPATGDYQYNWKSEKSWAGTCRKLTLTLADNTTLTATINFTR